MQVLIENISNYCITNLSFNNELRKLIELILTAEGLGGIEYLMSTVKNYNNNRHLIIPSNRSGVSNILETAVDKRVFNNSKLDLSSLGPCERGLASYIAFSSTTTIIVTGAMGSGKSTLVNFVIDFIKENLKCDKCISKDKCINKKLLFIPLNFNHSIFGSTKEEVMKNFEIKLYNQLRLATKNIFSNEIIINSLVDTIKDVGPSWVSFDFFYMEVVEKTENWFFLSPSEKCKKLVYWIHREYREDKVGAKIDMLSKLLRFASDYFPEKINGCVAFLFDNIDRFPDEYQNEILNKLFGVVEETKIKTIIPVRLTTFGQIKGNASFSYGLYQHAGPIPVDILYSRLRNYVENKNIGNFENTRKTIDRNLLKNFDRKIDNILRYLKKENGRLGKVITALSGLSVRRALRLSQRLLINNVIRCDEYDTVQDYFIRSLFIGENENALFSPDDTRATNIFTAYSDNSNSLINLRILQILNLYKLSGVRVSLKDLVIHLQLFGYNSELDITLSINKLIYVRKRLVYINGISELDSCIDLRNEKIISKQINITLAGQEYISNLIENIVYVYECFSIIDWTINYNNNYKSDLFTYIKKKNNQKKISHSKRVEIEEIIKMMPNIDDDIKKYLPQSIDNNSIVDRFSFLRKGLEVFLYNDILETIGYFNRLYAQNKDFLVINSLISLDLIDKLTNSVYFILRSQRNFKEQELLNWLDLIVKCDLWNTIIFDKESPISEKTISRLTDHIHDMQNNE